MAAAAPPLSERTMASLYEGDAALLEPTVHAKETDIYTHTHTRAGRLDGRGTAGFSLTNGRSINYEPLRPPGTRLHFEFHFTSIIGSKMPSIN